MSADIKNLKNLQNTEYSLKKVFDDAEDFLPLLGTDYVEGNATVGTFLQNSLWFSVRSLCWSETGFKDRVSYVLKQDKIRLVLTTPLTEGGPVNEHINKHFALRLLCGWKMPLRLGKKRLRGAKSL